MHVDVVVGRIGRAHGIRGDVFIDVITDEPKRRFVRGAQLSLDDGTTLEVASVRSHGGRLLVSFAGIADRTTVETLTGSLLHAEVDAKERPSGPEEFFDRQLVGLSVRDHGGDVVGTIAQVQHMPAQDLLVVDVAGQERLVPFVHQLVPVVDIDEGYVQLARVGGLLEDLA